MHLTINPSLLAGPANYPDIWTEYTITVVGVSATPVAMNFAFRYFVTSGGPAGDNSNFIGIDTFSIARTSMAVSNVNKSKMSVYPNPTNSVLHIQKPADLEIISVTFYNSLGQTVLTTNSLDLSIEKLPIGIYEIQLSTNQGEFHKRIIKQ